MIEAVNDSVLSQDVALRSEDRTHHTERQIDKEADIHRSIAHRIIHQYIADLKRRLIAACSGLQQHVIDDSGINGCAPDGRHFETFSLVIWTIFTYYF